MIIDIFILLIASFVQLVATAFSAITFVIPDNFTNAVEYFVAKLSYISGFVNVVDILAAFGWFLSFTTYWYTILLLLWAISFVPFLGGSKSPKL